jgi:hypothetical protein
MPKIDLNQIFRAGAGVGNNGGPGRLKQR